MVSGVWLWIGLNDYSIGNTKGGVDEENKEGRKKERKKGREKERESERSEERINFSSL